MSKETIQQLIDRHVIDNNGQWNHEKDEAWILAGQGQFKITREEFNAAADRMRGKPDWKDAPEWAQWLGQVMHGGWFFYEAKPTDESGYWGNKSPDKAVCANAKGVTIGDWRNTLEKRPEQKAKTMGEAINIAMTNAANKMASDLRDLANAKAPAKPWFESGELPAVGEVVMVNIFQQGTHEATVIGAFQRWVWLDIKNKGIDTFNVSYISPIKTDKEKAIEAAVTAAFDGLKHASGLVDDVSMNIIVNSIYDAGLLRLPDQK